MPRRARDEEAMQQEDEDADDMDDEDGTDDEDDEDEEDGAMDTPEAKQAEKEYVEYFEKLQAEVKAVDDSCDMCNMGTVRGKVKSVEDILKWVQPVTCTDDQEAWMKRVCESMARIGDDIEEGGQVVRCPLRSYDVGSESPKLVRTEGCTDVLLLHRTH